jgi:hypothetical protein
MTTPTPPLTGSELDRAIIDASREFIVLARTFPRDEGRIAAARAAIDDLRSLRRATG